MYTEAGGFCCGTLTERRRDFICVPDMLRRVVEVAGVLPDGRRPLPFGPIALALVASRASPARRQDANSAGYYADISDLPCCV